MKIHHLAITQAAQHSLRIAASRVVARLAAARPKRTPRFASMAYSHVYFPCLIHAPDAASAPQNACMPDAQRLQLDEQVTCSCACMPADHVTRRLHGATHAMAALVSGVGCSACVP